MKAVITVFGKDTVGIVAKVCTVCARFEANVTDVSQTILSDMFAMLMMVDLSRATISVAELSAQMKELGRELGLTILVLHEDVFDAMHHI